ncbi:chitin synthase [Terfezia boudieri ATCC MYA-4762]|uniref:chitin synthase n=1 Tax=Terfezia boudieri ATCC MYA-4762 TaxID=1051890 RepID=A0A3N4LZU8_9PEZI|nr:chitin synthase [Terfezia boudieri ATCC MYA-4762]
MPLPQRPQPASSPGPRSARNAQNHPHSGPHRSRDLETAYIQDQSSLQSPMNPSVPLNMQQEHHPAMASAGGFIGDMGRKRSLIRPERNRINKDHPNYHYHQHAQQHGMNVLPSTTGNDPLVEEAENSPRYSDEAGEPKEMPPPRRKLTRKDTRKRMEEDRKRQEANMAPPSFWNIYCAIVTFWCPNAILKCFGKPAKAQQRAWREKMGLISLILLICGFVGFLTFGFTQAVCGTTTPRLKINHVDSGYMIIHGRAYNFARPTNIHPPAPGIPQVRGKEGAHILYDVQPPNGGKDASFLFQNVNGQCKGLIERTENSIVPTDDNANLAWYFPCKTLNQDGSSVPNMTWQFGPGVGCHTSWAARKEYYKLKVSGDVYFTWDDIKNSSRNLIVYSGNVLDLNLLNWLNPEEVKWPEQFDSMKADKSVRGTDITHAYQSAADKRLARCLSEVIRVGSIDTETVGCIASKVVLYVSLAFILSIVMIKFILALFFGWFLSWRLGAARSEGMAKNNKARQNEIEDWADDIYRPPPKLRDADRGSKRSSFLPTTSRFTSPYTQERPASRHRAVPTTMASQTSTSRLLAPGTMYQHLNGSKGSLSGADASTAGGSYSTPGMLSSEARADKIASVYELLEGPDPMGFIHEAVVPQPPPEYQPFGYPLAHTICLITAYSEGEKGIRTTLDSIATTDYPNSHKLMLVICDGMIKGHGETIATPDIVLEMMKDHVTHPAHVKAFSYVAVASGTKRHNMAKVYAGFYDYGNSSIVPIEKQQRVPMLLVVKCGTPDEASTSKAGNRGKRDSQIILMSFLQKVMFDERMTELEFEMFNGIWKITGISPDYYETVLMVDADTKVFPDSLTHMIAAVVHDPEVMGLCGETKIANKRASWVSMIQVFEYFISHHLSKAFESVFGGVTCLPGCFCMYRIKAPKGGQNYWVPILANPDVVEHYSENIVDTLHKKNLLLLGEDRYLSTLMLRTFPKRKQIFVPQAVCKTIVPEEFKVLLSQRRRWINSTVHNLMELVLVRDLCGTFCFSMQFVVFIELIGTLVLPAAIIFTFYLIIISFVKKPVPIIPLTLLGLILGLPAVLIVLTAHRWSYVLWMFIYLLSLPIWNLVLPSYAFWKFDDFSWGDTRKVEGETGKDGHEYEGEFDSSKIVMKREENETTPSIMGAGFPTALPPG